MQYLLVREKQGSPLKKMENKELLLKIIQLLKEKEKVWRELNQKNRDDPYTLGALTAVVNIRDEIFWEIDKAEKKANPYLNEKFWLDPSEV